MLIFLTCSSTSLSGFLLATALFSTGPKALDRKDEASLTLLLRLDFFGLVLLWNISKMEDFGGWFSEFGVEAKVRGGFFGGCKSEDPRLFRDRLSNELEG